MFRRFPLLTIILALACCAVTPALASSHLVGQKKTAGSGLYFAEGLVPTHSYKLSLTGKAHTSFSGVALETYLYIANRQLETGRKSIPLKGTLPRSFTIKQPVKTNLSSWSVALQVGLPKGKGFAVRLYDVGKK